MLPAEKPWQRDRRRVVRRLIVLGLVLIALLVVWLFVVIDDWGRDFRENEAQTSIAAADVALRPIATTRSLSEVASALRQTLALLPNWSWASDSTAGGVLTVRLVRTTKLLRFKDDVTVRVVDEGSERVIHAVSRSRVGKADLGQNPRNLRELFTKLREALDALEVS